MIEVFYEPGPGNQNSIRALERIIRLNTLQKPIVASATWFSIVECAKLEINKEIGYY